MCGCGRNAECWGTLSGLNVHLDEVRLIQARRDAHRPAPGNADQGKGGIRKASRSAQLDGRKAAIERESGSVSTRFRRNH